MARDTTRILTALVAAANDDVVYVFCVERTFVHDRLDDVAKQIVRADAGKCPAIAAEGRAFAEIEISIEHFQFP